MMKKGSKSAVKSTAKANAMKGTKATSKKTGAAKKKIVVPKMKISMKLPIQKGYGDRNLRRFREIILEMKK